VKVPGHVVAWCKPVAVPHTAGGASVREMREQAGDFFANQFDVQRKERAILFACLFFLPAFAVSSRVTSFLTVVWFLLLNRRDEACELSVSSSGLQFGGKPLSLLLVAF